MSDHAPEEAAAGQDEVELAGALAALPEGELRRLVRHAATGIYEIDFRGPRFLSVNDFMCAYSGYSREELLAMDPMDLLAEESQVRFAERIEKMLAGVAIDPVVEYRFLTKRGEVRWCVLNITPTFEDGRAIGAFVVGQDVTERKRAEKALEESEERFRSLLRSSRDVLYRVDLSSDKYDYISPSVEGLTGFSAEELIHMDRSTSLVLVHAEDLPLLEEATRATLRTGQGEAEYRQRTKYGEYRWLSNNMVLVRGRDGEPLYRVGTIRDVTAQKEAAAALAALDRERATQEERARLARDLHDSVTQSLFAATLKAEALTLAAGDQTPALTALTEEVRRLNRGALAQMRTMLLELRGDPVHEVPLHQLLRNLVETAESRASVRVHLSKEDDLAPPAVVHEAIYRITQEALNNIVQHAGAQNAWVELEADAGHIRLVVRDDGFGFDPTSARAGHVGLGSIGERTAESGGRLSLRSAPGEGTELSVTWRLTPDASSSPG